MFRILDKSYDFKNKKYIYPSKQKICYDFVENVKEYCDKIILFGSAITMHCKPNSDLDFAISVKSDKYMNKISKIAANLKNGCDIIWIDKSDLSPLLKKNIDKGVVIYG